jgi:hypothetical protein
MLIVLFVVCSLGLACCLVWKQKGLSKPRELDQIWHKITSNPNPSSEDIKVIAEVAKVRQTEIPWYERSLSTIGIVTFFSMLIATGYQAINSAMAENETYNLRQEIKGFESQRDSWNKLVKELSEVIVLKQSTNNKLEKSETSVLRQRLDELDKVDRPTTEDQSEKLKIYMALKQFGDASALIEKSTLLTDEASPENLLFLAEVSFIDGEKSRARDLLKKFESGLSKQPVEWQLRFFVLSTALSSDTSVYHKEVAAVRHVSVNEADEWLQGKVDELKEQARKRNVSLQSSREE